jgi:hypothetical protein
MNKTPVVATTKYAMAKRWRTPGIRNFSKSIHPEKRNMFPINVMLLFNPTFLLSPQMFWNSRAYDVLLLFCKLILTQLGNRSDHSYALGRAENLFTRVYVRATRVYHLLCCCCSSCSSWDISQNTAVYVYNISPISPCFQPFAMQFAICNFNYRFSIFI